ncbi:LysR family transcriptional regulator [Gallaecimonas xiamenensis]|uniref:Transcriptional regulator n=1 Tax=Gallaecimonas xiamenensis 3-C-1 TaxID=745411 RepID=K2K3B6_9GAMM|nr:LysR family transcriptional regulator [Gallaecimonas xiamenensis]EKE77424.1 transcriptional regulator [Gallaecimonas xiamenensis 3-C-1]
MSLTERLADMAVFASVVDAGSFSLAAGNLGLSKGAVSKAVSRLEGHLKLKLLHRTTRQLRLTAEGQTCYDYCRQILQSASAAEEHLGELRCEPQGLVRISAPVTYGSLQVAPLLPELMARHPKLQLDLSLDDRQVDLVAEQVDIAVRGGPLASSSLIARPLAPLHIRLLATPDYFARHGRPQHPEDLGRCRNRFPCLTYSSRPGDQQWRFYKGQQHLDVNVASRLAMNNNLALRHCLMAGLGLAYLPTYSLAEELAQGQLETVLEDFMPQPYPVNLVYAERRHLSTAIKATLDFLQDKLSQATS